MRTLSDSLRPLHLLHLLSLHLLHLPALPAAFHLLPPSCRGLEPRALPLRSWVPDKKNSSTVQRCTQGLVAQHPVVPARARERDRSFAPYPQRVRAYGRCVQPNWWSSYPSQMGVER